MVSGLHGKSWCQVLTIDKERKRAAPPGNLKVQEAKGLISHQSIVISQQL